MIGRNDVTGPRDVKITHFRDHHGDVRSRQLRARRDRVPRGRAVSCFLAFLDCSPAFPCLTVSFFFEIERFQFPFLVSLLFLFVLVHGHCCSVVVGFSISQPPFPSSQYVIPLEKSYRIVSANFSRRKIGHAHDNSSDFENVAGVREPSVHAHFIFRFENGQGNQSFFSTHDKNTAETSQPQAWPTFG